MRGWQEPASVEIGYEPPWTVARLRVADVPVGEAKEWLAQRDDRLCMVEVDELEHPGYVRAGWLEACCPHCQGDAWRPGVLDNAGWVSVPGCEADLPGEQLAGEPGKTFRVCVGSVFEGAARAAVTLVEAGLFGRLPSGVRSVAEAAAGSLRQVRFEAEGLPPARWRVGLDGAFAGTRLCPECGGIYLVAYGATLYVPEDDGAPVARARVSRTTHGVEAVVCGMTSHHKLEFSFVDGSLTVDGVRDLLPGRGERSAVPAPVQEAFDQQALYEAVAARFPRELGVPGDMPASGGLFALALRNRFQGYPEGFYDEASRMLVGERFGFALGGMALLPVSYADIDFAFGASALPPTKGVRRAAFGRPALLGAVLALGGLPFCNVDVLQALLGHPKAADYLAAIAECIELWCEVAWRKGDAVTWRYMLRRGPDDVRSSGKAWAGVIGRLPAGELECTLVSRPIAEAVRLAPLLEWELDHGAGSGDGPYAYLPEQRALEGAAGGYGFALPARPRDVLEASVSMGNCLAGYAGRIPRATIVLVNAEGRSGRAPEAAVEVDLDVGKVCQALLSHNRPIPPGSALDAALRQWAAARGLAMASKPE